ncbi:DNA repair protein xrcc3 [Bulinus truncatus]|nr:DNA repair protein xrcc3 [Bulinus truncatus]
MSHQKEKNINVDLDYRLITALKKAQIFDTAQVLHFSCTELQHLTSLSSDEIVKLKDKVAEKQLQYRCHSAFQIFERDVPQQLQHWKLSTACSKIDSVLRGGVLSGTLTEVTGESGCGKTQLCLQLCISVQLNKEQSGGAVFICTESVFPSKRLQQMIKYFEKFLPGQNLGDKIFVEHVADFETLEFCVKKKLPTLLNRGLVKLIIIDSVTALFRCHYDLTQTISRAKHLTDFASLLRSLAHQYSIVIICVNQVSANVGKFGSHESNNIPALGLTWSNQVTCRLRLHRHSSTEVTQQSSSAGTSRRMEVIFAPHLSQSSIDININEYGIQGK